MVELFKSILGVSISGSLLLAVLLIARVPLKKAPGNYILLLWALAAIRLIIPVDVTSPIGLAPSLEHVNEEVETIGEMVYSPMPSTEVNEPDFVISGSDVAVSQDIIEWRESSTVVSDTSIVDAEPSPIYGDNLNDLISAPKQNTSPAVTEATEKPDMQQVLFSIAAALWLMGAAGVIVYTAASYANLRKVTKASQRVEENVYVCDYIESPFVLGVIKPRIYLPSSLSKEYRPHVLAHERAHIKRGDHIFKIIGQLVLAVHWFNPIVWISYAAYCRDTEFACDEKVIKAYDRDSKADYAQALLDCRRKRRSPFSCPLAFGEIGIKERVKRVFNYKKPALWICIAALIACAMLTACFGTGRNESEIPDETNEQSDREQVLNDEDYTYIAASQLLFKPTWEPDGLTADFEKIDEPEYFRFGDDNKLYMLDKSGDKWVERAVMNETELTDTSLFDQLAYGGDPNDLFAVKLSEKEDFDSFKTSVTGNAIQAWELEAENSDVISRLLIKQQNGTFVYLCGKAADETVSLGYGVAAVEIADKDKIESIINSGNYESDGSFYLQKTSNGIYPSFYQINDLLWVRGDELYTRVSSEFNGLIWVRVSDRLTEKASGGENDDFITKWDFADEDGQNYILERTKYGYYRLYEVLIGDNGKTYQKIKGCYMSASSDLITGREAFYISPGDEGAVYILPEYPDKKIEILKDSEVKINGEQIMAPLPYLANTDTEYNVLYSSLVIYPDTVGLYAVFFADITGDGNHDIVSAVTESGAEYSNLKSYIKAYDISDDSDYTYKADRPCNLSIENGAVICTTVADEVIKGELYVENGRLDVADISAEEEFVNQAIADGRFGSLDKAVFLGDEKFLYEAPYRESVSSASRDTVYLIYKNSLYYRTGNGYWNRVYSIKRIDPKNKKYSLHTDTSIIAKAWYLGEYGNVREYLFKYKDGHYQKTAYCYYYNGIYMSTYLSFGYSDISDGIESYIADITNNKDESKSREEYTAEVMKKYPQYFGLKTSHGLDVVFWTAVPDSYSFALFEHSDKLHDDSDKALNDTELIGVTIDEMKAILATYTEANLIDANDIHLIPRRDTSTNNVGVFWLRFTDETDEEVEARRAEYIENIRKLLSEN